MIRFLLLCASLSSGAAAARAEDVTLFAAASLGGTLDRVAAAFEAETGDRLVIATGGSAALAQQIRQGAPADLFLPANADWMDALQADGLIDPASRVDLLGNDLVLIGPAGASPAPITPDFDLVGRLGDGRLAMGLVDAVPAGQYGKAALVTLGLWEDVAPAVVQADNVRAALAFVALGEAPLGIVYATDAAAEPRVGVIGTFPQDSHPPIVYPVAAVAQGIGPQTAAALDFLTGPTASALFRADGFAVLAGP